MSDSKNHIKTYTAQDIDRYLNRQMSAAEMHALEKAALDDPFLAEAIEGYMHTPPTSVTNDIEGLTQLLNQKTDTRVVSIGFKKIAWSAAAAVILLIGAVTTWFWLRPVSENSIAQQKSGEKSQPLNPTPQAAQQDNLKITTDTTAVLPSIEKEQTVVSSPDKQKIVPPPASASDAEAANAAGALTQKETLPGRAPVAKSKSQPATDDKSIELRSREITNLPSLKDSVSTFADVASSPVQAENQRSASGYFSPHIFSGTITDDKNKPLPFVNISIPNTPSSTYSDAQGNFRLTSADTQLVVHLRSVGFQEKEIALTYARPVTFIQLQPHSNKLDEVVVTGYGTRKKKTVVPTTEAKKQTLEKDEEPEAEPKDGWAAYDTYMMNNSRLPDNLTSAFKGSVELSFTVGKYGMLSDFRIEQSTCNSCNKEAIRLIKEGPAWKLVSGEKPARVTLTMYF